MFTVQDSDKLLLSVLNNFEGVAVFGQKTGRSRVGIHAGNIKQ